MRPREVVVAGAGIAGLAAAIALAKTGFRVTIRERDQAADHSGAGIQLSPNATRALEKLGVLQAVASRALEPLSLIVSNGTSGAQLAEMPLARTMRETFNAPYLVCLRADLHAVLLDAASAHAGIMLRFGDPVRPGEKFGETVLIGADGVRSAVRCLVASDAKPRHAGLAAWRALVPASEFPETLREKRVRVWLGPGAHLVHYPVGDGGTINVVAVARETRITESWGEAASPGEASNHFADFHETPRSVLARATGYRRWSLFDLPPLPRFASGNIALAGDAAHAMLPFIAQGAAAALEDAVALSQALGTHESANAALAAYDAVRRPRATGLQQAASRTGAIYHLPTPFRHGRDLVMRALGSDGLMRRQAWIYRE
jgi:salicylate hydroxylase